MSTKLFVAGDVLTAAEVNTYLQQRDAWTSFTPTLTNVTEGNGTKTAYYNRIGRIIHWHVIFTLGSTSAITGSPNVALPVTAARTLQRPTDGMLFVGGFLHACMAYMSSTSVVTLLALDTSTTYGRHTSISATVPGTWTTSDYFACGGTYEAAAAS